MSSNRTAGGPLVYVQQELSSARRNCETLKYSISQALDLINSSSKKDHFYAVAGDIIQSIPANLLAMEAALDSAAMMVDKLDYEELRQVILPEKVDELERVLEDVRIRIPRRIGK
ncbi:MAG TPA: hypothetical protein VIE65_07500 [Methylobacter sp.]|jgi:hypothetical protein